MKRRHVGILLMLLCTVAVSSATSILWCSGKADTDYGWIDLLETEGYTVDRLEEAAVMTQAKVDLANTYDLVIVGRDVISGDYANVVDGISEVDLWNSITSPMICQTGYLWRSGKWKWLNNDSTLTTSSNIVPDVAPGDAPYDILFNGAIPEADGSFDYCDGSATLSRTSDAGNGVLIGHRDFPNELYVYAAYWGTGLEFYSGSGQYATAPRLALGGGNPNDSNRGAFNLTDVGTRIFLNAVEFMTDRIPASGPSPSTGSVGVQPTTALTWTAGLDPNGLATVNPAIKKHYVWLSNGNPADPNLSLVYTVDVTNYSDPAAEGVYSPPGLTTDKVYYWMVEEGLDNGLGGAYSAGDPNNLVSPVWMFDTSTAPFVTEQPVSTKVAAGETAVFEMGFDSISDATVTWYKNSEPLSNGGDIAIDTDPNSSILSIANVDASDEGQYYAIVSNLSGNDSDPTDTVYLGLKKQLAWYQFEQNADDSVGTNNGTVVGGMDYTAGKIATDSQVYAADPNGTNYIELTTDVYPKAGFGNGLDAFTYSCWVNLDEGEGGIILGEFNEGQTTGLRFSINSVENDISVYMRQEGGSSINPRTSVLETDSQWHYVAVTYDGSEMKIYVDGAWRTTSTNTLSNFVDWQLPFAVLAVNSRGSFNERFTGQVDDLKIYNYAFTSAEIAQEYLGVEGGWICDTELPELVYDFDDNCQVDLGDLALLATTWLDSNRVYDDGM